MNGFLTEMGLLVDRALSLKTGKGGKKMACGQKKEEKKQGAPKKEEKKGKK